MNVIDCEEIFLSNKKGPTFHRQAFSIWLPGQDSVTTVETSVSPCVTSPSDSCRGTSCAAIPPYSVSGTLASSPAKEKLANKAPCGDNCPQIVESAPETWFIFVNRFHSWVDHKSPANFQPLKRPSLILAMISLHAFS